MLSDAEIAHLLEPYGATLTGERARQLSLYLDVLLRWNEKINLTAIRNPEKCVTRHFGESLALASHFQLKGRLLDIGSGAGFPGLALKLAVPSLKVTLLEPVGKKRAFLKEVVRQCGFHDVEVQRERLDDFRSAERFDIITARAVGPVDDLVARSADLLAEHGRICLWLSREQCRRLPMADGAGLTWIEPFEMPLRRECVILVGIRSDVSRETSFQFR